MTSSSHPSVMWTLWRVLLADEVIYFPIIDRSDNALFHLWTSWREEKEIHVNIYHVLSTLKSHYLISSLCWPCEVTIISVLQMKKLLMIQKIKYFAYISSKWKNRHMSELWVLSSKAPALSFASHFIMIVFTCWGISHLVLAFLRPAGCRHGCLSPANAEPLADPYHSRQSVNSLSTRS